jgi:hypothetical protein
LESDCGKKKNVNISHFFHWHLVTINYKLGIDQKFNNLNECGFGGSTWCHGRLPVDIRVGGGSNKQLWLAIVNLSPGFIYRLSLDNKFLKQKQSN